MKNLDNINQQVIEINKRLANVASKLVSYNSIIHTMYGQYGTFGGANSLPNYIDIIITENIKKKFYGEIKKFIKNNRNKHIVKHGLSIYPDELANKIKIAYKNNVYKVELSNEIIALIDEIDIKKKIDVFHENHKSFNRKTKFNKIIRDL